jgi:hypothetical protein
MSKKAKRVNPPDATRRNIRATHRLVERLTGRVARLEDRVAGLLVQLKVLKARLR